MTPTDGNILQRKQNLSDADSRKRMSCNGCRVLRKGCSDTCSLRPCLQWIESPEAQGHATVFVAKFFGRAGLMAFISAVPDNQRPALFQSLLYEACGRTVNPVNGAVGLLWSGNWHVCQAAVDTVLKGGALRPPQSLSSAASGIPTCSTRPSLMNGNPWPSFRVSRLGNGEEGRELFSVKPELDFPIGRPLGDGNQQPSTVKIKSEDVSEIYEVRPNQNKSHHPPAEVVARRVRQRTEGNEACSIISRDDANPAGDVQSDCVELKASDDKSKEDENNKNNNVDKNNSKDNPMELDLTLNCELSGRPSELWKQRVSSPSVVSVNSEGSVTSLESGSLPMPMPLPLPNPANTAQHEVLDLFP